MDKQQHSDLQINTETLEGPELPPRQDHDPQYADIYKVPGKCRLKRIIEVFRVLYFIGHFIFSVLMLTLGIQLDHFTLLALGVVSSISLLGMTLFLCLKGRNQQPVKSIDYTPYHHHHYVEPQQSLPTRERFETSPIVSILPVYAEAEFHYNNEDADQLSKVESDNATEISTIGPLPNIHRPLRYQTIREENSNLEGYLLRNGLFHLMNKASGNHNNNRRFHNWHKFNHRENHIWSKHYEEEFDR